MAFKFLATLVAVVTAQNNTNGTSSNSSSGVTTTTTVQDQTVVTTTTTTSTTTAGADKGNGNNDPAVTTTVAPTGNSTPGAVSKKNLTAVEDIKAKVVIAGKLAVNYTLCKMLTDDAEFTNELSNGMAKTLGIQLKHVTSTATCKKPSARSLAEATGTDVSYTYNIEVPAADVALMAKDNLGGSLIAAMRKPETLAASLGETVSVAITKTIEKNKDSLSAEDLATFKGAATKAKTETYTFDEQASSMPSTKAIAAFETRTKEENPTTSSVTLVKGFVASLVVLLFAC